MSKFIAEKIDYLEDSDGNLLITLKVPRYNKWSARIAVEEERHNEKLQIEVTAYKSKRSLEQNRMLWALLGKLAEATSGNSRKSTTEDWYVELLEEANIKSEFLLGLPESEESLKQSYRVVKQVETRTLNGKEVIVYKCSKGSSKFNTKEMTDLIDTVLDKLAELGIVDSETEYAKEYVYETRKKQSD